MAKKSKIAKNRQREQIVARYAEKRRELKKASVNPHLSASQREEAMRQLHALPRDASPVRLRNRDSIDGRPRGYLSQFGLSRVNFRSMANQGKLPGVRKASW